MEIIVSSHACKLVEFPDAELEVQLRQATKYEEKSASFRAGNQFRTVDGKPQFNKHFRPDPCKYLYHRGHRTFPSGLLSKVLELIPGAVLLDKRPAQEIKPHGIPGLRHYQATAAERLLANERSSVELPTGTGKTRLCAALAMATKDDGIVLLTVPTKKLMRQTLKALKEVLPADIKLGYWGENKYQVKDCPIVVAIIASVKSGIKKPERAEFLKTVRTWILDETHGAATTTYIEASRAMPNARRRNGVTATWRREDGTELIMEGVVGPLVYRYTTAQAIEEGFLMKPVIELHHYYKHERIIPKPKYSKAFLTSEIYLNEDRNDYCVHLLNTRFIPEKYLPCLVIVESLEQGDVLAAKTGFPFIDGERTSSKDVDRICEEFNAGKIPVLIASRILGTGVDLPEMRGLLIADPVESETTVKQRLGRLLRLCEGSVLAIDLFDHHPNYLEKHAYNRRFIYVTQYPGCVVEHHVSACWKEEL